MPIYHYYAMKQLTPITTSHIDGIAIMEERITDMDGYASLKKLIAEWQDIGGEKGLTICSLTLLQD